MNRKNSIICIIATLLLIGLGLGLGLYFGLKNNSNSSTPQNIPQTTYELIIRPELNPNNAKIWSPELCNQYLATCQDNIKKGLLDPKNAMESCSGMMEARGCTTKFYI